MENNNEKKTSFMSIGKEFMYATRFENMDVPDRKKGMPQPPLEKEYDKSKDLIDLVSPYTIELEDINFRQLINSRKSIRKYSNEEMNMEELSYLLWSTQGVREIEDHNGIMGKALVSYRTVPSAGAKHPFETIVLVNKVKGLTPGLYRYIATKHKLMEVSIKPGYNELLHSACYKQNIINDCAVALIWIADVYRTAWSYGERAYRYVHLDAGHVCQNFYLAAESIKCGACCIATFNDQEVNDIIGVDGEKEFVVYIGTIGKK